MTIKTRVAKLEKVIEPEYMTLREYIEYSNGAEFPGKKVHPTLLEWLRSLS